MSEHDVFLKMAEEISRLGTCCRLKVGCILVNHNGHIIGSGYNGALPGIPHCTPETCGLDKGRCIHTAHAEESALMVCKEVVWTAYVTHEPCLVCTRLLAASGCSEIIYSRPYNSMSIEERYEKDLILKGYRIRHYIHKVV